MKIRKINSRKEEDMVKGSVRVLVSTKRLRYELNLRRNITIIQGDSASGKTTMIQIIGDYLSRRAGPGTEVVCDRKCVVLSGLSKYQADI